MDDQRSIDEILSNARSDIFAAQRTLEEALRSVIAARLRIAADAAESECARAILAGRSTLRSVIAARLRIAADAAELERARSILAGRTTPPTAAEVAAHYAAGGKWRVVEHECERDTTGRPYKRAAAERTLSEPEHISAYKWEVEDWKLPTTWWALDKGYLLTTWPQVEAQVTPDGAGQ